MFWGGPSTLVSFHFRCLKRNLWIEGIKSAKRILSGFYRAYNDWEMDEVEPS